MSDETQIARGIMRGFLWILTVVACIVLGLVLYWAGYAAAQGGCLQ